MVTLESTRTYLHTNLTLKILDPVLTSSLEKRAAIFFAKSQKTSRLPQTMPPTFLFLLSSLVKEPNNLKKTVSKSKKYHTLKSVP
ncbi:hypothetical protein ME1_00608 [Bartonella vinsonii subsp. arupensis OK-94-513]|uniref:Uncharacterized protein n=1 Tax=Bartonella vinsonii subsp. arupensis OK-94-513 TaxID=1094562 RepID=J1JU49_BARVI|nr:hypothetical protein ME1_00608 [Bartonella vinsonii subsp. arupensis OK-94-513]